MSTRGPTSAGVTSGRVRPPRVATGTNSRDPYDVGSYDTRPQWEHISQRLASRLAAEPSFATLRDRVLAVRHSSDVVARLEYEGHRDQAAAFLLLARYHTTFSHEDRPLYVAMQQAVQREFGLHSAKTGAPAAAEQAAEREYGDVQLGLRAFFRAMYDETQDWFKQHGITSVRLYRTVAIHSGNEPHGVRYNEGPHAVNMVTKALTSYSTDARTASLYGDSSRRSMLVRVSLPANRILSTGLTGLGDPGDREVIALGGRDRVTAIAKSLQQLPDATPYSAADVAQLAG